MRHARGIRAGMSEHGPGQLKSDSRNRTDRNYLAAKNVNLAQAEKIRLEEDQRYQRKLREAKHGAHK